MRTNRQTQRYAGLLLAGVIFASVVTAAVNTWVDPFRVTGATWASKKIDPYRDISASTRTGKTGLILSHQDWQVGIFGSSRVISSLDPQSPAWGDKKAVNLGMPGALMYESIAMAEYFIARQPAELVIFGIDPGDLTDTRDTRPMVDYMSSPLNPDGVLDRKLRFVFGVSTFETSLETLVLQSKKTPGEYNAHGFRDRPGHSGGGGAAPGKGQLNFIKNRFVDDARVPAKPGAGTTVNKDKAEKLETMIRHCREKGIRLVMFFHPNHVLLQAKSADLGKDWVPFETDRKALVEMVERLNAEGGSGPAVELWDFYSYHPYNRERVRPLENEPSVLVHWRDLEHFTKDVGDGMLAEMMGWPVENPDLAAYGDKITSGNVEARIAKLRADYQTYLKETGAEDVKWKEELVKTGLAK
ncbi:hypothetical protein [Haloferula sp. BvORR071]|uniref:hypothetical protein n=1 Tax=Haloferula sp. BvORR071 TaxID=1396141 RepID=UPI0005531242|nr:hypothetical protein [Haloferula sp. BvORR071]